jgi:hypothetical protein
VFFVGSVWVALVCLPLSVIFCFAYVVAERGEIGPLRFGGGGGGGGKECM